MKREKIYKVKFIEYTNSNDDYIHTLADDILEVFNGALLIKESDIETVRGWKSGIKSTELMGELLEFDEETK